MTYVRKVGELVLPTISCLINKLISSLQSLYSEHSLSLIVFNR
jgi:hypothetical protein